MLSLYAALLACSEQKVTVNRQAPEISLVAPAEGTAFLAGAPVTFEAVVRDEDPLEALVFTWASDVQGAVEGELTLVDANDIILYVASDLAVGEHTVTLQVTDTDAQEALDSVSISVLADADLDGDGFTDVALGGDDCDDGDAGVNPEAPEIAYNGVDDDCDAATPDDDLDGDGFPLADDCDDGDADVNPDAAEIWYDGVDQDCDGEDGDQDGDGFAADAPDGGGDDCDDREPAVHPEAEEICDGVDNDCDGTIDGADAVGATTWYIDEDSDGFGAESKAVACEQPEGYASLTGDCDDSDGGVNPDASEAAYNGVDDDCDAATPDDDLDGDGFPLADDCDDGDAAVNPDAAEIAYDGADNDCDAATPDDDLDADGFPLADDCDDAAETGAAVHPDAVEICDGLDNDCDGTIDGPDATDAVAFYADDDEDGFGDALDVAWECALPGGYAEISGDCDDGDEGVNPDAEEICDDGVDQDCDGEAPACLLSGVSSNGVADAAYYGETNNDYVGYILAGAGDVDGDGCGDLLIGAPEAGSTGTAYLVTGCPLAGEAVLSDAAAVILGAANNDELGGAITGGDLDGDGVSEVLLGAVGADDVGAVWIFSAPSGALTPEDATGAITAADGGEDDWLGHALDASGDIDGDGIADLIVTAPGADPYDTREDAGLVLVFLSPGLGELDIADADFTLQGAVEEDGYGASALAMDFDGDGLDDVAAGAPADASAGRDAGAVYVFLAAELSGTHASNQADVSWLGGRNDAIGRALAAGDLDGDGAEELILGAPEQDDPGDDAGAVFVLAGGVAGQYALSDAAATLRGAAGDLLGESVAAGDVDGDGAADLLVGARGAYGDSRYAYGGEAALFYGMPSGELALSDGDWHVLGDTDYARLGGGVALPGDLSGDGPGEIVLGSPNWAGGTLSGAVFIFEGGGL